jgi:hypothetical protein
MLEIHELEDSFRVNANYEIRLMASMVPEYPGGCGGKTLE